MKPTVIKNLNQAGETIAREVAALDFAEWPSENLISGISSAEDVYEDMAEDDTLTTFVAVRSEDSKTTNSDNSNDDSKTLTLLGTVRITDYDMDATRNAKYAPFLAALYVKPAYRRLGLARRLVLHALAFHQSRSTLPLHLWHPVSKPHLRQLYKSLGWTPVQECEYAGSTYDKKVVIIMRSPE